jgi:hypothetical protein
MRKISAISIINLLFIVRAYLAGAFTMRGSARNSNPLENIAKICFSVKGQEIQNHLLQKLRYSKFKNVTTCEALDSFAIKILLDFSEAKRSSA